MHEAKGSNVGDHLFKILINQFNFMGILKRYLIVS